MASEPLPPSLSSYSPTQPEKLAADYLFNKADTDQLGVLTGDKAVPFFSHSSLPPLLLGQIWQLADPENSGFLSPERFGVACRLIGHAQQRSRTGAGEVRDEWVGQPGPLPHFSNHPLPAHLQQAAAPTPTPASPPPAAPAARLQPQSTGQATAADKLTRISPDDKAKYARVFAGANGGSLAGLLDGDKARDIFIKSNLPYEVLGQIWNLADTHSRGALDLTDFTIGLHLVHLLLDQSLTPAQLPAVLDPKLYAAAAGLPAPAPGTPTRQSSLAPPPAAASPAPAPAPAQPQLHVQTASPAPVGAGEWRITPAEKAEADQWFDGLDAQRKGTIEGEQAVGFFGQSGLGVEVLAKVWDLADLRNEGHLNKDTFAVAMHLLKQRVSNPTQPLPDSLPADLVPPAYRAGGVQSQVPTGPQRDLLDLLDDDAPVAALQPQSTGASLSTARGAPLSPQPTGSRLAPLSPQGTGSYTPQPVVPAGTAQAISPQPTGGSARAYALQGTIFPQATGASASGSASPSGFGSNFAPSPAPPVPAMPQTQAQAQSQHRLATSSTFFDDNDDEDTAQQVSALRSQEGQLKAEEAQLSSQAKEQGQTRAELEAEVGRLNGEVAALQARIASARETYAAERTRVDDLRTRENEGKDLLARARHELISAESDLSALRLEKTEVEGEVLRDKEDVREVKRRVAHVEEEKRVLLAEVEKLKKEGRKEKGLAAIARKQLASVEAGRDAAEAEMQALQNAPVVDEPLSVPQQQEHAAQVPLPATPAGGLAVVSPAGSTRSTNPFDRLAAGLSPQSTGGASTNPFAFAQSPVSGAASPAPAVAREEPAAEQSEHSLPIVAAAAVGTGALAALGAAGTAVAGALGVGHAEEEQPKKEDEPEADPFGVPAQPAQAAEASFDDGFGDDFAASTTSAGQTGASGFDDAFSTFPLSAASAPAQDSTDDRAAFDDAFASFPSGSGETAPVDPPVEGTLGDVGAQDGFDDAFRDLTATKPDEEDARVGKDAVEGTLGDVEKDAGFGEAFREVEEAKHAPTEEVETAQREDDSSDDDEDGPEDVFGASGRRRSRSPSVSPEEVPSSIVAAAPVEQEQEQEQPQEQEADEPALKTREATNASSDSGGEDSFVHVDPVSSTLSSSALSGAGTSTGYETPLETVEGAHGFDPVVGPSGTAESQTMLEPPAPAGFAPATPSPAEAEATPAAEEPTVQEPEPVKEKRRAAPPPPQRTASATTTSTTSASAVPAPPAAAVDNGFASAVPAPVEQEQQSAPPSAEDDFDSAFAGMGPSSTVAPAGTSLAISPFEAPAQLDQDANDDDAFDFKPDFADDLQASTATSTAEGDGFDDAAFADFDSSFPAVGSPSSTSTSTSQPAAAESAFDDAFSGFPSGAPALGAPVGASSGVEQRAASPLPPTPKDEQVELEGRRDVQSTNEEEEDAKDDSEAVKEIRAMGFTRKQAVESLEKFDYDVNRAANSLLGMA
ncbi:hypothetical protein JCM10207_005639 [Rhodosporidiobolus poonsookiae]